MYIYYFFWKLKLKLDNDCSILNIALQFCHIPISGKHRWLFKRAPSDIIWICTIFNFKMINWEKDNFKKKNQLHVTIRVSKNHVEINIPNCKWCFNNSFCLNLDLAKYWPDYCKPSFIRGDFISRYASDILVSDD